jgi:PKD repeat protein/Flp pilus assembly protein TadG
MLRRTPVRGRLAAATAPTPAHRRRRTRGQSLVEFALVLPVLLFLTLIALDFGRVYLGYINLQNMARIAANFAANNSSAWDATPNAKDAKLKTQYYNQIIADAQAINCQLIDTNGDGTLNADDFTPTFTDRNGDGNTTDLGDSGQVQIGCRFGVITPGIAAILGNTVKVAAASSFPVKTGMTSPGNPLTGSAPNAAFSGNGVITSVAAPTSISGVRPFDVEFRDTSGGQPTAWEWTFPDTGTTLIVQDPLIHTFNTPGTFIVSMKATNMWGSSTAFMTVIVADTSTVDFTADKTSVTPGTQVKFSDQSTSGGTAWAWTFGTGEGTSTQQNPNHTYNTPGVYTVALTVTYPSPTGNVTATKVGYIAVQAGTCKVPSLNGVNFSDAQGIYSGSPNNFTGVVIRGPNAPAGNFKINQQDLVANSLQPCSSDITVNKK